jgi:uncharacterized membrane protein
MNRTDGFDMLMTVRVQNQMGKLAAMCQSISSLYKAAAAAHT